MDKLLLIDTETTGLDPATDVAIEVGAVIYSLRHRSVVRSYSTLLAVGRENAAEAINHIASESLAMGVPPEQAWKVLDNWGSQCDAVLAHRAEFDRGFVPAAVLARTPWICTKFGIKWPLEDKPGSSLIYTALAHGLGVVEPHRALSDCMLLARLLTRCAELGHDVQAMLARGLRPMALFQALVSFEEKDRAKEAGFEWEGPTKRWLRKMAIEDAAGLGFPTRQVQP